MLNPGRDIAYKVHGVISTVGKRKRRGSALRHPRGDAASSNELRRIERRRGAVGPHEELLADVAVEEAHVPRDLSQPAEVCNGRNGRKGTSPDIN